MKLYKFRSLTSCLDAERAEQILETGKIWCSKYWELNDPMEGVYRSSDNRETIDAIFGEKSERVIGSLSAACTLRRPLMWGYYASGFKGIAIEFEVDDNVTVEPMTYTPKVVSPRANGVEAKVREILLNKLEAWEHEEEWRFLDTGPSGYRRIGNVTGVYVGRVYPKTQQHRSANHLLDQLSDYEHRLNRLLAIAKDKAEDRANAQRLWIYEARIRGGRVMINKIDQGAIEGAR